MTIGLNTVKELQSKGKIKALATFIYLKSIHSNSCFFKPTLYSLSKKTGLSRTLLRKYLAYFIDQGWCEYHSGNLIFKNVKKAGLMSGKRYVIKSKSIKENVLYLQSLILKQRAAQYDWVRKVQRDIKQPSSVNDYKKAKQAYKKVNFNKSANAPFSMSITNIGLMYGVSRSKAFQIVRDMKRSDLVNVLKPAKKLVAKLNSKAYSQVKDLMPNTYIYKGGIFKVEANQYIF